jgi:hypothetical protein
MRTLIPSTIAVLLLLCSCWPSVERPPPDSTCVDFQALTSFPQTFAGPAFTIRPLHFINPTHNGVVSPLTLEDRVEDQDGRPELNVAISRNTATFQPLIVEFPRADFPGGVKVAYVTLRHSYEAVVTAKNAGGGVVATASQPQLTRGTLVLQGRGITRLEFKASETLLYEICWQ